MIGAKDKTDMTSTQIRTDWTPNLQEVVEQIRALKQMTKELGFQTGKSQAALLGRLNAEDLALVARALFKE